MPFRHGPNAYLRYLVAVEEGSLIRAAKPRPQTMAMAVSRVASLRGLALMPAYSKNLQPWAVLSRRLERCSASARATMPNRDEL
jgi:hypothetical protein